MEYSRGYEKVWVYGALAVRTGQTLTLTTTGRNTTGYLQLLEAIHRAYPRGKLRLIAADNLSSHTSAPVREWLSHHPRITHVFIPVGACWLNLIEAWWRLLRRAAYAGQSFATTDEIAYATHMRPSNSIDVPIPGSGAALFPHHGSFVVGFSTLFEERRINELDD